MLRDVTVEFHTVPSGPAIDSAVFRKSCRNLTTSANASSPPLEIDVNFDANNDELPLRQGLVSKVIHY